MFRSLLAMVVLIAQLACAAEPTPYMSQKDQIPPYESLNIILFQDLFDSITTNLVAPLIKSLPDSDLSKIIPDQINNTLHIEEVISFDYNLTGFAFADANYNGAVPIATVIQNQVRLQLSNLTLNLTFDYAYVSDPPIFADIGSAYLGIDTLSIDVNLTSSFENEQFNITIENIELGF